MSLGARKQIGVNRIAWLDKNVFGIFQLFSSHQYIHSKENGQKGKVMVFQILHRILVIQQNEPHKQPG
jgi:hypothetical protein